MSCEAVSYRKGTDIKDAIGSLPDVLTVIGYLTSVGPVGNGSIAVFDVVTFPGFYPGGGGGHTASQLKLHVSRRRVGVYCMAWATSFADLDVMNYHPTNRFVRKTGGDPETRRVRQNLQLYCLST